MGKINLNKLVKLSLLVYCISIFYSCKKDEFIEDSSAKLELSEDSILFDTVFTTIGSVTKQFKIYNRNNQPIKITSIKMGKGTASQFKINVDGVPGSSFTDVEIPKKDSLFVFVEATIDPTNVNSPLIVQDQIVFTTNGNTQTVQLEAWGQDAYYHYPDTHIDGFPNFSIICNSGSNVWINDKPHVIYGYAVVDSNCTLTIQAGVRVYLHQNAGIWVYRYGSLKVQGTLAEPVTFQGDRLEPDYKDLPGQWDRIWINEGDNTTDSEINYAIIKNGFIGIQIEPLVSFSPNPSLRNTLALSNTVIKNMSGVGILGTASNIVGTNTVIANCAQYLTALTLGGSYSFRHCTFANYWNMSERTTPSIYLNNYNSALQVNLDSAYFGNCIVDGTLANEIQLDSTNSASAPNKFKYKFEFSMLKTTLNTSNSFHYISPYINKSPDFVYPDGGDYRIYPSSFAKDNGNATIGAKAPLDLFQKDRTADAAPDLGAYEN